MTLYYEFEHLRKLKQPPPVYEQIDRRTKAEPLPQPTQGRRH